MRSLVILFVFNLMVGVGASDTVGAQQAILNLADGSVVPGEAISDPPQGAPQPEAGVGCVSGVAVGPACWFLGQLNESCNTVCANASGGPLAYDEATRTFAGSDGTNANCESVLDALGIGSGAVTDAVCAGGIPTSGAGCIVVGSGSRARCTSPPTDPIAAGSDARRACACAAGRATGAPALHPLALVVLLATLSGVAALRLRRA